MSSQQTSQFPIVGIPKIVFTRLSSQVGRHFGPATVNEVVQDILSRGNNIFPACVLKDPEHERKFMFEDEDIKRVRLTQQQFAVLRDCQEKFRSEQINFSAKFILGTWLTMKEPELWDYLQPEKGHLQAEGLVPDGHWEPVRFYCLIPEDISGKGWRSYKDEDELPIPLCIRPDNPDTSEA